MAGEVAPMPVPEAVRVPVTGNTREYPGEHVASVTDVFLVPPDREIMPASLEDIAEALGEI